MIFAIKIAALLIVVASFTAQVSAKNTYAVYLPHHIRLGEPINYVVCILNTTNSVIVSANITNNETDDGLFLSNSRTLHPGESSLFTTDRIPLDHMEPLSFNIRGTDAVSLEEVFSDTYSSFELKTKTQSIMIETDKAIYQPGQTVKFRAAVLDSNFLPLKRTVTYEVEDPNGNVIMLKENVKLVMGVSGDEIDIHHDSPPGIWKITFRDETNEYEEHITFEVKRYKLPKFEVEIESSPFYSREDDGITIKLRAKYTYGKPVSGKGFLLVEVLPSYLYEEPLRESYFLEQNFTDSQLSTVFVNFEGENELFVHTSELELLGWWPDSGSKLMVIGSVKEDLTDIEYSEQTTIPLNEASYQLVEVHRPTLAKPGLLYTAYLKVTELDGNPVRESFREDHDLLVSCTFEEIPDYWYSDTFSDLSLKRNPVVDNGNITRYYTIPPSGEIVVNIDVPNENFMSMKLKVAFNSTSADGGQIQSSWKGDWRINRAASPTDSYLQILTNNTVFEPDSTVEFSIRSNKDINHLQFVVKARGNIIDQKQANYPDGGRYLDFELEITRDMMPSATLLVSYVAEDGEIVADYIQFTVEASLQNQVSMESSSSSVDAGDDVTITVKTSEPGSYVGLKAVDKSVLLLKPGNDITMEKVNEERQKYNGEDDYYLDDHYWWMPRATHAVDATGTFYDANIHVLTDGLLYRDQSDLFWPPVDYMFYEDIDNGDYYQSYDTDVRITSLESGNRRREKQGRSMMKSRKPRTYFPETWMWLDGIGGKNGSVEFKTTAPDTITSWVLSAFSISETHGLGIADQSQIRVFRNFFVNLNLPLKVTRGEIIVAQALVFNYFNTDIEVTLTLHENSAGFELIMPVDDEDVAGFVRRFTVPSQGSYSVSYPIRMISIGDVDMQISASSVFAADSLIRKISVKPEGIQQCFSQSTLINRDGSEKNPTLSQLEVTIPDNVVEGSENVKLYVYGDIMGSTTRNLGSLLREPTGCGEQNMQSFAPDVFVTLYLQKAGRLDDETKEKAYKHFVQGYQNQLNYRHDDGSYSAFGKRDKSGSLWLTAFVTKCFLHAATVRPGLDSQLHSNIEKGINFMSNQLKDDGSYNEPGVILSTHMQGGVDSNITVAAYILISITEVRLQRPDKKADNSIEIMIEKTRRFLEDNLNSIKTNRYALSIVTYALHTSGSQFAQEALDALELLATVSGSEKHWHEADEFSSTYDERFQPCFYKPPSNDIEMTAYALLTYAWRNDVISSLPVLKWLASKRNDLGGYSSTQNTVIAIQALSAIAGLLGNQYQDITVTAGKDDDLQSVNIQESNAMVFNRFDLPATNGNVKISADGSGVAVAQLSICYNVIETPYQDSPFDCKLDISDGSLDSATLNFCCRLKNSEKVSTGMVVYELQLPNGFTMDLHHGSKSNVEAKRVELKKGSANYYYDQLSDGWVCSTTVVKRDEKVAASKPSTIIAQDYYQPERRFIQSYSIGELENATACAICGEDCAGCPAPYLTDWSVAKSCTSICGDEVDELETQERLCFDPNKNEIVSPDRCGVELTPTRNATCRERSLPVCPDVHYGLFGFLYLLAHGSCKHMTKGESTSINNLVEDHIFDTIDENGVPLGIKGVPGMMLKEDQYLQCDEIPTRPDGENYLNFETGFTTSLLLHIEEFDERKTNVLLSIGSKGKSPCIMLERKYWGRKELKLSASYGNKEYRISRIPSTLFVGRWAHVLLTWNRRYGVGLYVDGKKVGFRYSFRSRRRISPTNQQCVVVIGGRTDKPPTSNLNAHVSSLAIWERPLDVGEIRGTYLFYEDMLTQANMDIMPELPPKMLLYLQEPKKPEFDPQCFDIVNRLSVIENPTEDEMDCVEKITDSWF